MEPNRQGYFSISMGMSQVAIKRTKILIDTDSKEKACVIPQSMGSPRRTAGARDLSPPG